MAEITERVRKMLWANSAGLCAMCRKPLVEDLISSSDPSVLGQECHIIGESNSELSPRGLHAMPPAKRNLYGNLILLCRDHHKIIDDQVDRYPINELLRIKHEHEKWVRSRLEYDEQLQADNDLYMSIAEEWEQMAGLDDWDVFTIGLIDGTSPEIMKDRYEQLEKLLSMLYRAIYPKRYSEVDLAFENFRRVLHDLRSVFRRHVNFADYSDLTWKTTKFYQTLEYNPKLVTEYEEHVRLLYDLTYELTRAANYVCEMIRKHLFSSYRLRQGRLVGRTEDWRSGEQASSFDYRLDERGGIPYPGLDRFLTLRCERDRHFGPVS